MFPAANRTGIVRNLAVFIAATGIVLVGANCSTSSASSSPSTKPHSAHKQVLRIMEFPTADLQNLGAGSTPTTSPSATNQGYQREISKGSQALLVATNGTTYGSATMTGTDLILGGFLPGTFGFADEGLVQDTCDNNSSSVSPILLTNATSAPIQASIGGYASLQAPNAGGHSGGFAVMWTEPLPAQSGNSNFCSAAPQANQVIPYGTTLQVDPGYTGVVWAMLGGSAYNLSGGNWITMSSGGFYDFRLVEGANDSFSNLIWGEAKSPYYGLQNGPVGFNIVSCAQNAAGGWYPNVNSVLVNGSGSGNIKSSALYSGELSYGWNQPICLAAGTG